MRDEQITTGLPGNGVVRKLSRQEMPLLREHLLRLDPESRRDRFNGFADESFIERGTVLCRRHSNCCIYRGWPRDRCGGTAPSGCRR